jgi:tetratricopeptide (TPR) repeat protein
VAYQLRTRGKTDLGQFQSTLAAIRSIFEKDRAKLDSSTSYEKIDELYGWTLHEFGVALQNVGRHFDAKLVLQKATAYRILHGDLLASYSVFQTLMNGFQARRKGLSIDDFAPSGWRNWLSSELDRYATIFRQSNSAEHHGNTIHNRAFVHQAMAMEYEDEKRNDDAEREFTSALQLNMIAYNVRMRLRDPRMMAQSQVRIAQCMLGLARVAYIRGNINQVRDHVEASKRLVSEAEEIYKNVPQEDIRKLDVQNIKLEINKIERDCLKSH